jgi:hypothetical protein
MFTVKLVEHNGHEQIYSASEVWAEPASVDEQPKVGDIKMRVFARVEPPPLNLINPVTFAGYGIVYVMNDAGKTVAKYWLGYGDKETESPCDVALRKGREAREAA